MILKPFLCSRSFSGASMNEESQNRLFAEGPTSLKPVKAFYQDQTVTILPNPYRDLLSVIEDVSCQLLRLLGSSVSRRSNGT